MPAPQKNQPKTKPQNRLKNPACILITGASSGIGAALARDYAAPDITLLLTGRNTDRLDETAAACRDKGAQVKTAIMPVQERAAMADLLERWDKTHPIDLAIANAGISAGMGGTKREDIDRVYDIFDINVTGVLNTLHPLIPRMAERKSGQLAVVSSLAGFRGLPSAPAYSASKAGVMAYGLGLAGSLKKHGITVSVICPGFIRSRITDANDFPMPFFMESDKAAAHIRAKLAKGRLRTAFPWPMAVSVWFLSILPASIGNLLLSRAPSKP